MHIIQKTRELIVLANKAKVLLGVNSDSEPRITTCCDSNGDITITFKSSCFPFFSQRGFYTFPEKELDIVLDKCRLFVKNLEQNVNMGVEIKHLLFEKEITKKEKPKKAYSSICIVKDGKKMVYKYKLCNLHKKIKNMRFFTSGHGTRRCYCSFEKEETDV